MSLSLNFKRAGKRLGRRVVFFVLPVALCGLALSGCGGNFAEQVAQGVREGIDQGMREGLNRPMHFSPGTEAYTRQCVRTGKHKFYCGVGSDASQDCRRTPFGYECQPRNLGNTNQAPGWYGPQPYSYGPQVPYGYPGQYPQRAYPQPQAW